MTTPWVDEHPPGGLSGRAARPPAAPAGSARCRRRTHLLVGLVEKDAVDGVGLLEVHGPRAQRQVAAALRGPRPPVSSFCSSRRFVLPRRRLAAHGGGSSHPALNGSKRSPTNPPHQPAGRFLFTLPRHVTRGRPCLKGAGRRGTGRRGARRGKRSGRRLRADRAPPRPALGSGMPRPLRRFLRVHGSPAREAAFPRSEAAPCVGLVAGRCQEPDVARRENEAPNEAGTAARGLRGCPQGGAASSHSLQPRVRYRPAARFHAEILPCTWEGPQGQPVALAGRKILTVGHATQEVNTLGPPFPVFSQKKKKKPQKTFKWGEEAAASPLCLTLVFAASGLKGSHC